MRVRRDLAIAEAQLRDYQSRIGEAFAHESYLTELTDLRDQLKDGLSATGHETGTDSKPDASELAAWIKTLVAANSVEAMPQRVQSKQASAEEPITARVRKRHEVNPASDRSLEHDPSLQSPALQPPGTGENSSAPQPMAYKERIAMERQRQEHQPSLP